MSERFKIASPQITSEIIDGEVMIINLKNGKYYSMTGVGGEIWSGIQKGFSVRELTENLSQIYQSPPEILSLAIKNLLKELNQEELVVPFTEANASSPAAETKPIPLNRLPFHPPVLNKYTDMQDLLLLDPIHDVDEAGWPMAKEGSN